MKLTEASITQYLKHDNLSVETYHTVTSTNTLLKQRGRDGAPHGLVIAAETQTNGRGRMGRSFFSPTDTGIYFSVLLRPTLSPEDCLLITTAAAVAAARVLDKYTREPVSIKWVNDLYTNGKKVCGILTESAFSNAEKIDYAILGIGINLTSPKEGFPHEFAHKAGSIFHGEGSDLRGKIIAEILNEFFNLYETIEKREFIKEYRSRSLLDGKPVDVIKHDRILPATALFIDEDLTLAVRYDDGTVEHLSTGDVSIRTH